MVKHYPLVATALLLFLAIAIGGSISELEQKIVVSLTLVGWIGLFIGWYLRPVSPPNRVRITKFRQFL
jgi:hypothetical protein